MEGSTCCCCFSIRTGVFTLGVLSLLGGMVDIIFGSIVLSSGYNCYSYDCYDDSSWYGSTTVVQGCITCLVSILVLVGMNQKKPNLLMPYVVMMIVNVIAYYSVGVILLINIDYYSGAYMGIWFLIWGTILMYFINVVRLYRLIMIQQILAANGFVTAYPGVGVMGPGVVVSPYPSVATVYANQPVYSNQHVYTNTAYPPPGSYPQPGYPQSGYPQSGYPQSGIYQQQATYPPPYPGNQPGK